VFQNKNLLKFSASFPTLSPGAVVNQQGTIDEKSVIAGQCELVRLQFAPAEVVILLLSLLQLGIETPNVVP